MGIGKLIRATRSQSKTEQTRAITEFAIIDGVAVDGSGLSSTYTYSGAMAIPGAWRSALLLSDLLGSVPWHAYRTIGRGPAEMLDPTPALIDQPAPPDTRMTTFSSWALDLVWHGNAVGLIAARNSEGWPTAVLPVPANWVGVGRVGPGSSSFLPVGEIEYSIGGRGYSVDEVIHIKGPCQPGALRGMGVLEAHLSGALTLATEQARQARSLSQHGVPTGTLKSDNPDLTSTEATELKAAWLKAQQERTIAVLNSTTHFTPLSWNPEELQLVEARKFSLHELALIFGLPLSFLGADQSSRTYSNIEQEGLNLIKFSLAGHLARFEQTLSLAFPRGTRVRANLDAILRADTLTRYQAHALGIGSGFLTANEARELEDRPPLPEAPAPPAEPTQEEIAA